MHSTKAAWLLLTPIVLALGTPAFASEVIAVNSPQGMVVVADKRLTAGRTVRCQTDCGEKVRLIKPFLVALTGEMGSFKVSAKKTGTSIVKLMDALDLCCVAVKEFPYKTLLDRRTPDFLARRVLAPLQAQINLSSRPQGLTGRYATSLLILRPDSVSKRIECVFAEFIYGPPIASGYSLVLNPRVFIYEPNVPGFRLIGESRHAWKDLGALVPDCRSDKFALIWAEDELKKSHKAVISDGLHTIGDVVDEYLVGYDGTLKVIAQSKKLLPAKPRK